MRWWVVLACAGCGRLAFEARAVPDDAMPVPDTASGGCSTEAFDQLPAAFVKNGNGDIDVVAGRVTFSIDGVLNSEAFLELATAASFVGRSIAIEAVAPSQTPSASTAMGWHEQTGDFIGVHLEMDGVNLKLTSYNPTLDEYIEVESVPYDPVELAWWRLRDGGNDEIVAEVSRDGAGWNKFASIPATDLTNMKWDLGLGAYVGTIAPSETSLDNLIDCVP